MSKINPQNSISFLYFLLQLKLVEHETERREQRLKNAANNDVWEYRKTPPDDWDKPLPANLETKKKLPNVDTDQSLCVIS